ncbi:MAG: hypothetical protein ABI579_01180 [Candidatus Sumerlaeota bacterium]
MSNYVLDKSYRVANASGIGAGMAVVATANNDECDLPVAANAANVLGATTHVQTRQGRFVGVRRLGIAIMQAGGVIAKGARVCVADNTGRIAQTKNPIFTTGVVGSNNALIFEWLEPSLFAFNTSISLVGGGANQTYSWSITNGILTIKLATNGSSAITETATSLLGKINADATLNAYLKVTSTTGSTGAGIISAEAATAGNIPQTLNSIGVAEEAAAQAGDMISVLLLP